MRVDATMQCVKVLSDMPVKLANLKLFAGRALHYLSKGTSKGPTGSNCFGYAALPGQDRSNTFPTVREADRQGFPLSTSMTGRVYYHLSYCLNCLWPCGLSSNVILEGGQHESQPVGKATLWPHPSTHAQGRAALK